MGINNSIELAISSVLKNPIFSVLREIHFPTFILFDTAFYLIGIPRSSGFNAYGFFWKRVKKRHHFIGNTVIYSDCHSILLYLT